MGAGAEPEQNLIANGLRLLLSSDEIAGDVWGGNLLIEDSLDELLWTDPPIANFAFTYPPHPRPQGGARSPPPAIARTRRG
jgi:hypothetical protein